jgi:putative copper export protein
VALWTTIRWLHLLAMAFFVGGQLMLAAVLVPVARGTETMRAAARRFGVGTLAAIGVLIATGIPLASHYGRWDDGRLHAKLGLVLVVGVLVLLHMRRPQNHAFDGLIFIGSLAIVYLGVALAHA